MQPPLPPGPVEVWAFRAGRKPVCFLTVSPETTEGTLALFPGAHVEQRSRLVHIEARDRWVDRRDRGEARVELYISGNPELAREAVRLQADGDPTRNAARLGELLGYPSCCVEAFRQQADRSDNTRNRYLTAARTVGSPWFFELNNTAVMLAPFFPCSYRCEAARAFVRAVLSEIEVAVPAQARELREHLRRPVLYFGHDEFVAFDGRLAGPGCIEYSRVFVPRGAPPPVRHLAQAIGAGDRCEFDAGWLRVVRDGVPVVDFRRLDPGLGFVAGFD